MEETFRAKWAFAGDTSQWKLHKRDETNKMKNQFDNKKVLVTTCDVFQFKWEQFFHIHIFLTRLNVLEMTRLYLFIVII